MKILFSYIICNVRQENPPGNKRSKAYIKSYNFYEKNSFLIVP